MKTIIAAATVLASLATSTSAFALEPTNGRTVSGVPEASYQKAPADTSIFYTGSISNQSRDEYRTMNDRSAPSLEPSHGHNN